MKRELLKPLYVLDLKRPNIYKVLGYDKGETSTTWYLTEIKKWGFVDLTIYEAEWLSIESTDRKPLHFIQDTANLETFAEALIKAGFTVLE